MMRSAKWAIMALSAVVVIAPCLLGVSGCSMTRATAGAPDPALQGQWVLASGTDTFGRMNLLGQDITLSVTEKPVSTGRSSCSDYSATIYGSLRDLWVTTHAPQTFSCATADQSVLQLEYLLDLARVRQSVVTSRGLELSAQGVDLRFIRAEPLRLRALLNAIWEFSGDATITLHAPFALTPESGGSIRFLSPNVLSAETRCEHITADLRQVANELVASNVTVLANLDCARSDDRLANEFMRLLDGGFSFAVAPHTLTLTSTRAGLSLGFNEQEMS